MGKSKRFLGELSRRNVLRAGLFYMGASWALAQGVSQLAPALGLPDGATRWFIVAAVVGFPFWIAFSWFYELTPQGFRREREIAPEESITRTTGRKLDFAIIGVLALAVVLLLTDRLMKPLAGDGTQSPSIAVLPFENLSADKDGDYFVVGMQDEILTRLSNIGDLKVVSRTSTEKYRSRNENLREVGRELGVGNIVEGSVQRAGDKVRITVQLIDALTDTHLWAQSYDREMRDVFAVQSDVAGKIAAALKLTLQPGETEAIAQVPTADPVAYDLFLRAEYLANLGGLNTDVAPLKAAVAPYRQAIARDPSFALALARLSFTQSLLVWFGAEGIDSESFVAEARVNAERALALNPQLADAYIALGFCEYYGRQDYQAALASFATAQRLRPNDAGAMAASGYVYRRQGRIAESARMLEQALDHDPRNSRIVVNLAVTYQMMRRYADSEAALRRALALDPDNVTAQVQLSATMLTLGGSPESALDVLRGEHPFIEVQRAWVLRWQRRYPEAIAVIESIVDTPDVFGGARGFTKAANLGFLYGEMGDVARSRQHYALAEPQEQRALIEAEADGDPVTIVNALQNVAEVQFGLGRTDEALQLSDRAQGIIDGLQDEYLSGILSALNADLYGRAGRADLAVPLLDRVLSSPNGGAAYAPTGLVADPSWDRIRDDPAFIALMKKYPASSVAR
ncbi:MAG: tetratricopeptide repeat protein [Pseudomonadota bacterium]|nr:tetratricopeptide repeat protein [Pseudomonadota bacterium]